MISRSTKSSRRFRLSMTVTLIPRAAKIEAYSSPMTPAPTTVSDRGSLFIPRIPSLLIRVSPSQETFPGCAGCVPTAMTIRSAVWTLVSACPRTVSPWESAKEASPKISSTRLRRIWASKTSSSRPITKEIRTIRSFRPMFSFTAYDVP